MPGSTPSSPLLPQPAPSFAAPSQRQAVGRQLGALCFRRGPQGLRILLVTSRNTGRWVVPKGWPMPDRSPAQAAATEVWEEAGARGRISAASLGLYAYVKRADSRWPQDTPCVVTLYPFEVTALARSFPERTQRRRRWFSRRGAACRVAEPGLARLFVEFRPELYFP